MAQAIEEEEPQELAWTPEELCDLEATDTLYGPIVK